MIFVSHKLDEVYAACDGSTLAGVMLLGLIFSILNLENGLGWISLSAYRQAVIRGAFLLPVVAIQARLVARSEDAHA